MPAAGPSELALALLREGVADADVRERFWSKVVRVPGSECLWWTSAVSGNGHGRFWLGRVAGRDVGVIAHRFAWACAFGVESLLSVPVLGHRCDNPLCQSTAAGHVQRSTTAENAREWIARRGTVGNPLRDARGARGRSRAIRDALVAGVSGPLLAELIDAGMATDDAQLPLWGEEGDVAGPDGGVPGAGERLWGVRSGGDALAGQPAEAVDGP